MDTTSFKTKSFNRNEVEHKWYLIDAENMVLGRMATQIASILRGKNKPQYTPHDDCGDYVVVINAEKIRLTGNKMNDKEYIRYTGYPGGQRKATPRDLLAKKPQAIIENAVRGMLPKNKLGRQLFKKLFVYAGSEHKHHAQKPEVLSWK